MSAQAQPGPKPRRYRPLQEKIGQIVLVCESLVAFLGGLVLFGLNATAGLPSWAGIVAGCAMGVACVIASGLLRWRWGYAVGWALQGVFLLGGFLEPGLFIAGLVFGGFWAYAVIGGARTERRVQRQRAAYEREHGSN